MIWGFVVMMLDTRGEVLGWNEGKEFLGHLKYPLWI